VKVLLFLFIISFCSWGVIAQEQTIRQTLEKQERCWNEGDLECFMQGYWQSDKLLFVGANGPQYGWQATLDNYRKSYPDKQAMGTLKFALLQLRPLGKNHYFVLGKWKLARENDTPNGFFTLIFEKMDGQWVIIADHSS